MKLAQRLAALESSGVPTWVFDFDHFRFLWVNGAAMELWRAADRDELLGRDFSSMTASTRARMAGYFSAFRQGRSAQEEWTLYPHGVPILLKLYLSGVESDDGRLVVLIQAFAKDGGPDPELVRGIEVLRHTSVVVVLLDESGATLLRNPAALRVFGAETPFAAWFVDAEVVPAILDAVRAGQPFESEVLVRTSAGERWHMVEARPATDPVTGAKAILVHQTDETARRGAEHTAETKGRLVDELHRSLSTVDSQRREILTLSAPILDVGRDVLAVPIIGSLDPHRSVEIAERLLHAVVDRRARHVILDLTGSGALDAAGADHLKRMVGALRMLGARVILTGIQPAMAMTLLDAGVDLSGVTMLRSLREGIAACLGNRGPPRDEGR